MINWLLELEKINRCPQRQDSTTSQLKDLILVADRLGFYDASDYLIGVVNQTKSLNTSTPPPKPKSPPIQYVNESEHRR